VVGAVAVYRDEESIQAQTPGRRDVIVFERIPERAGVSGGVAHFGFRGGEATVRSSRSGSGKTTWSCARIRSCACSDPSRSEPILSRLLVPPTCAASQNQTPTGEPDGQPRQAEEGAEEAQATEEASAEVVGATTSLRHQARRLHQQRRGPFRAVFSPVSRRARQTGVVSVCPSAPGSASFHFLTPTSHCRSSAFNKPEATVGSALANSTILLEDRQPDLPVRSRCVSV
jgi:hypothetical protein